MPSTLQCRSEENVNRSVSIDFCKINCVLAESYILGNVLINLVEAIDSIYIHIHIIIYTISFYLGAIRMFYFYRKKRLLFL